MQHSGIHCSCISTDIGKRPNVKYDLAIKVVDYAKKLDAHYIRVFGYFFSENKEQAHYVVDYGAGNDECFFTRIDYTMK